MCVDRLNFCICVNITFNIVGIVCQLWTPGRLADGIHCGDSLNKQRKKKACKKANNVVISKL